MIEYCEEIMTIQQTLKIVDGRLMPSSEVLDASLIEVSSTENNALQIKDDGLFVLNGGGATADSSEIQYIDSTDMETVIKTETGRIESRIFKIKLREITESDTRQSANFLNIFKDIVSATLINNVVRRDQETGGNLLSRDVYTNPNITKSGTNYYLKNTDYYSQPLDQIPSDFQINKINPGATSIEFPFSRFGDFICEVYLDGVLIEQKEEGDVNITRNYDTNMVTLTFAAPVVEGQVVKVVYKPYYGVLYSQYQETEYVTFTIGSSDDPVLTLIRPPYIDYSSETEYGTLYVTGVLK